MSRNQIVYVLSFVFLALAIGIRLVPHGYNFTAIGALGLFVGYFWSARIGVLFSLLAMVASDLLGHVFGISSMGAYDTTLMMFVYGGMAVSALFGKQLANSKAPMLWGVPTSAILAGFAFFLISNFGSWLVMPTYYARTVGGLINCYVAAIPFSYNTFFSTLTFAVAFFAIGYVALQGAEKAAPATAK